MLKKSPLTRLWKLDQIKAESWMSDFNWDGLISFALPPAFKISDDKENTEDFIRGAPYLTYLKNKVNTDARFINLPKREKGSEFDKWVRRF